MCIAFVYLKMFVYLHDIFYGIYKYVVRVCTLILIRRCVYNSVKLNNLYFLRFHSFKVLIHIIEETRLSEHPSSDYVCAHFIRL